MPRARITIGIPTYNGASRVDQLLRSIRLHTSEETLHETAIVIVDDGSPRQGETIEVWHKHVGNFPQIFVDGHAQNRGISAGWNTAARRVESEYVVLINDDVIVPSGGWLEALVFALENSPGVGGVGANWHAFLDSDVPLLLGGAETDLLVVPRDPVSKVPTPVRREYEAHPPGRVMCPTGQLFAFRSKDYDALGGFDEGYKSFFEESDFGTAMAAKLGKIGLQLNWPMCWHRWSATFGASPELRAAERMAQSRQRYIEKWGVPQEYRGDRPGPFDYTNPKHLGAIGDVRVEYFRKDGSIGRGVVKRDGGFVEC